jgi:hypothetical protein
VREKMRLKEREVVDGALALRHGRREHKRRIYADFAPFCSMPPRWPRWSLSESRPVLDSCR